MCLGGYSGAGRLAISVVALLVSSAVHANAVTADGFGRVIQQMVEAREAQVVSQSAGRVFATGASSLGMGAGIAVAAEVIRERPDVFDSIRMCGEMVGNPQLCTGKSVFAAAYGLAKHTIDDSISTSMSNFGKNMMNAGQATWGLLGQAAGVISIADLAIRQGNKAVEYITSGIKQDDGTYLLSLPNGATVSSPVAPSAKNPVAVYLPSDVMGFSAKKIQDSNSGLLLQFATD